MQTIFITKKQLKENEDVPEKDILYINVKTKKHFDIIIKNLINNDIISENYELWGSSQSHPWFS